jgi:hypothetical protein
MKPIIKRAFISFLTAFAFAISSPTMAFTADTTSANGSLTGLWNNAAESGWGASLIHQYGTIFATFYTYDAAGNPSWYVASACAVSGSGCTGPLYSVTGGTNLILQWNAAHKAVNPVGTATFAFTDVNTGTMSFTINGVNGSKAIARSIFASAPVVVAPASSGLDGTWSCPGYSSTIRISGDKYYSYAGGAGKTLSLNKGIVLGPDTAKYYSSCPCQNIGDMIIWSMNNANNAYSVAHLTYKEGFSGFYSANNLPIGGGMEFSLNSDGTLNATSYDLRLTLHMKEGYETGENSPSNAICTRVN